MSEPSGSAHDVTYLRWHYDGESFYLTGDQLLGGGGENTMNKHVTTITYDDAADELTISDKDSEDVYTFSRVSP